MSGKWLKGFCPVRETTEPNTETLRGILARADVSPLVGETRIAIVSDIDHSFLVHGPGLVTVSAVALASEAAAVTIVRHALELCFLLGILPDDPVLAGLSACRCAALFAAIAFPREPGAPSSRYARMVADAAPDRAELETLWPQLAEHQPAAPRDVPPATADRLAALWPFLGPTEHLIATGGDPRLHVDPLTGLNAYGCSPRPRPWAITFASSTASSISERGYAAAEEARRRMLGEAAAIGVAGSWARETTGLRREISRYYGLPEAVRVVLVPSGTDGELLALGVVLAGDPGRPLTNLLVGPEESGSGVPEAAAGRHFSTRTARGVVVTKGGVIDGVPADLEVAPVPVRTADGACRPGAEIVADCAEQTAAAVARGRRVLFHILDQSKTGLLAPALGGSLRFPDAERVEVIVDASQARLAVSSVRSYVELGAMVLLTGSKFFTGPPFSGALLVPAALAHRLDGLPAGFADYFGEEANIGLALRWRAALAEMAAFAAVDESIVIKVLQRFGRRIEAALAANPDLHRHEALALERPEFPDRWDRLPTIFTFSVWQPEGRAGPRRLFGLTEAKQIYNWLNSDLSDLLPAGSSEAERRLAARYAHIGQPVAIANRFGPTAGAFRLSIGARLVSGEPSHRHLDAEARIDREIADALAMLEKLSLIVRHFERIRAADPPSRFQ